MVETGQLKQTSWMSSEQSSRVEINGHDFSITEPMKTDGGGNQLCAPQDQHNENASDSNLGIGVRALAAAGAAILSAIIVNPLDVAKIILQAQAARVPYLHPLSNLIGQMSYFGRNTEGLSRLWRGTTAGLALAVPTVGIYLPCYDIFCNWMERLAAQYMPGATPYVPLVAGSLSRSVACLTCYPIELARTRMQCKVIVSYEQAWDRSSLVMSSLEFVGQPLNLLGEDFWVCWVKNPMQLLSLGQTFLQGFVAGSIATAATCPLDVAKTRRQIEKDPVRALRMTTRQTLMEVWRGNFHRSRPSCWPCWLFSGDCGSEVCSA